MRMRLDRAWPRSPGPQRTMAPRHFLKMLPLSARYAWYIWKTKRRNKKPIMDFINMEESKQIYGCPLGGIGTGSIGRGFKGEFCRFQLQPGIYDYNVVPEDQFLINIRDSKNNTIYQSVLSAYTKPKNSPASWEWNLNGKDCEYTALYPQAWTTYDLSKYGIKLVCKQISPVIPHNYKDSSLPCAVFLWDVINVSSEKRHVSITFTFRDVPDTTKRRQENKVNFERYCDNYTCGVTMEQKINDMSCTFTISKKKQTQDSTIDGFCKFNTKKTANSLWESLKSHGRVMPNDIPSEKHTPNAMGLSSQITLEAGCKDRLEFCLVWDMPVVHFGNKTRTYNRYYTKFFGNEGIAGPNIATYALMAYKKWEQDIIDWQSPIVDDNNLPDWFKSALMNELYYIADGGTVWFDVSDQYPVDDPRWLYGMFAYLEGHEYRMYNTYDVHFYASFALAQLWPNLQVSLQYQFKETTLKSITTDRKYLWNGKTNERKLIDSVPHDLGDPEEEPFILHNAYNIHDVSEWRDLNTKFILQVFRDLTFLKAIKQQQDNLDRYQSLEYIDEDVDEDEDLYSRSTNQNIDKVFDNKNKNNVQNKNKPLNGLCKYPDNENKTNRPRVKYVSISSEYNIDDDMTYVKHGSILRQNSNPFVLSSQISHYGELMAEYDTEVYDSERYLNDMYPVCRKLIDKMLAWDVDKDGLIENSGSADQTFDCWVMTGTSSYCGGLWLAALQCMQTMAALLGIQDDIKLFKTLLEKGKLSFEKKLWNGKYYEFDETKKVIMADQLCGQWYLRACGYQYTVFPKENVKSALKMIYDNNVLKFGSGLMGAVNGYMPATPDKPGYVDQSCLQSKESWTGVTYGLASLMIYEGMTDEAMKTAGGLYKTLSEDLGMSFETPEALNENGKYRSQGYMRPLSIWGMHHAYNTSLKNAVNR